MNALDRFSLKNKVILLTGGVGLYGRGLTSDLAEAGATLVIASRDVAAGRKVADEEKARGWKVEAQQLDQADEKSISLLAATIKERHGRIDGLVNNAVARPMTAVDAPVSTWEESMRVNATGLFLMHRIFGPALAEGGSIVNIGSIQGMVGPDLSLYEGTEYPPPPPDYFFHKGGMVNLTRYYAAMFGSRGVRVNLVNPGGFFTTHTQPFLQRYESNTFLGRMGNKNDLGGSVIFLLSDAAGYITGASLAVDGGYTAH